MSVKIAFLEYRFEHETKCFDEIIKQKAKRLAYLDSPEFFHDPKTDFLKGQKEKEHLEREIKAMYGFKLYADMLKGAYEDDLAALIDANDVEAGKAVDIVIRLIRKKDEQIYVLECLNDEKDEVISILLELLISKKQKDEQNSSDGAEPPHTDG